MTKHKHRSTGIANPSQMTRKLANFTVDMATLSVVTGVAVGTASTVSSLIKK